MRAVLDLDEVVAEGGAIGEIAEQVAGQAVGTAAMVRPASPEGNRKLRLVAELKRHVAVRCCLLEDFYMNRA